MLDNNLKAQLDQAEGQVKLYEAQWELAKATLERDLAISKTPGAVAAQQLDQDKASVKQALASIQISVDSAQVATCSASTPTTSLSCSYRWNIRRSSSGLHVIAAQAVDAAGNVGSASVSVTR